MYALLSRVMGFKRLTKKSSAYAKIENVIESQVC